MLPLLMLLLVVLVVARFGVILMLFTDLLLLSDVSGHSILATCFPSSDLESSLSLSISSFFCLVLTKVLNNSV